MFIVCELPDLGLRILQRVDWKWSHTALDSAVQPRDWRPVESHLGLRSAIAVMEFTSERRQADVDVLRRGNTVTNALLAFNSSVNFIIYCLVAVLFIISLIIYCLVGKKFRDILLDLLRCRRRTELRRQQYLATTRL